MAGAVSAVVAPREKYGRTRRTVERLVDEPDVVEVIVVTEGHAPRALRRWLGAQTGVVHVHRDVPTGANECRMLGVEASTAPFVLLIDNDCLLHPGSARRLVERAEATSAAFVSPVIDYERGGVHFVGGMCHLTGEGPYELADRHAETGAYEHDVPPPTPTEAAEMHAVLVRRTALDDAGGLDRQLRSTMDVTDLSLRLNRQGGGWVEPLARGTYDNRLPHPRDLPLFWSRWGRPTVDHDVAAFSRTWAVPDGDRRVEEHRRSCAERRVRPVRFLRAGLRRAFGDAAADRFEATLDRVIARYAPPDLAGEATPIRGGPRRRR